VPLILWPHGGPHSLTSNSFYREVNFFNELGYGVLFVNFRGSVGAGQVPKTTYSP
jgi:acylaminoacyl-peptidase